MSDAYHLALDAAGGIYVAGNFDGSGDFDPGAGTHTLTSAGEWDGFVAKLEANGDFAWALRMGGDGGDSVNSLLVDADGSVLVCGSFAGTADFGDLLLTNSGETDMFLARITQP
jgi:hypothetical protein